VYWTDAGVNWFDARLVKRHELLINGSLQANVNRLLAICCSPTDLQLCDVIVEKELEFLFSIGLHPHYATDQNLRQIEQSLEIIAPHPQCVAIGEAGLDYNRMLQPKPQQRKVFDTQLDWCRRFKMPLYLHQRDAEADTLSMIRASGINLGIAHCFTSNKTTLKQFLDLGFYIGITGWISDQRRNHDLIEALDYLPLDRIILETDAPYLTPRNIKPKPKSNCNLPQYIPYIAHSLAERLNIDIEQLNAATEANFNKLFLATR
jgi:TatD DNase family protein